MSTSLLYHTWGIRGYDYIHARYENGCTIFRVEQKVSGVNYLVRSATIILAVW